MTQTKNFLGIPVEGDISKADRKVPQQPLSELEPLIRAVLDDEAIVEFGWRQYTPYFNDGDACVFGVGEPWFRTITDPDPEEDEDWEDDTYTVGYGGHPSLGERQYDYRGTWPNREHINLGYEGPDEARFDRVAALSAAIDSGAFDDVLLESFGDHASVRVRATGITVDTYEHD